MVKIPRWPFDKFPGADRSLGTQMKATGEVMAIDRTFEAALLKAMRSLEVKSARGTVSARAAADPFALVGASVAPRRNRSNGVPRRTSPMWSRPPTRACGV